MQLRQRQQTKQKKHRQPSTTANKLFKNFLSCLLDIFATTAPNENKELQHLYLILAIVNQRSWLDSSLKTFFNEQCQKHITF